ncbi:MAG: hypothetical protein IJK81_04365 [Selenomonadaceae bacterium]|nr:hypothetical protein [Selenomonadaceae bacterium]
MNDFEKLKNSRRARSFNWTKGFEFVNIPPPDYQSMLTANETEISAATDKYIQLYNRAVEDFKHKTALTTLDMGILILAAALQTTRWLIVGTIKTIAEKTSTVYKKIGHHNITHNPPEFTPATVEQIADDFKKNIVPYDAPIENATALGHNPIAGLIVGTANIATNTLTVDDFFYGLPSYHVVNQQITGRADFSNVMKWTGELLLDEPKVVGAAFMRQMFQCGEDIFKKFNLPPLAVQNISPEMAEYLTGEELKEASFAAVINKIVEMFHRIFFNPKCDDAKFYEVRTRKILTYSNTLSSILNISCAGLTGNVMKLDTGGILVTLWRILNDSARIHQIQLEFINKTLNDEFRKEEDEINQKLTKWGFSI